MARSLLLFTSMSSPVILCATDLRTSGQTAHRLAGQLARGTGAAMHLLTVAGDASHLAWDEIDPALSPAADVFRARLEARSEAATRGLELAAKDVRSRGVECATSVRQGRPPEAILAAAKEVDATLIVVGAHELQDAVRGRLATRVLGTTADRVARLADVPVLVACGVQPLRIEGSKWFVAIDFSEGSEVAARQALRMCRQVGGSLTFAHVVALPKAGELAEDLDGLADAMAESAEARLEGLVKSLGVDVPYALSLFRGDACFELCQGAAQADADFLVMGNRGHGRIASILLGSTAEKTLRCSPVPVFVTRSRTHGPAKAD